MRRQPERTDGTGRRTTAGREYVKACLEDLKILRQKGCKIKGKWTASYTGILGNVRTNTLSKEGTKDPPCHWIRTTLTWLSARPYHQCMEILQNQYGLDKKPSRKPLRPWPPPPYNPRVPCQEFGQVSQALTRPRCDHQPMRLRASTRIEQTHPTPLPGRTGNKCPKVASRWVCKTSDMG